MALAMNVPMQVSSSNSLISLSMTSSPRSGSGKTTTGSRNSGSAMFLICERDGMRTAGFYCPDEGRLRCLLVALQAAGPLRIGYGASPWVAAADVIVNGDG